MKRRTVILGVTAAALGLCGALYGICNRIAHRSEGPRHVFTLPGDGPVTDDDALRWSKEVLAADGRFSPDYELQTFGDDSTINRGTDPAYASVCWRNRKTGWQWYVQFKRSPGKVECVSYPGK